MSLTKLSIVLLGALAVAPGAVRAQHDHAAHAHVTQAVAPPVQRWAADAALRDGMGRIHTALEELRHYEMGHMDATMALDRVGLIEQATTDIFAKCKLAPEQDAVLHGMLVPLLGAAQKLKTDPRDMAQVQAMRNAVADYPRYFDDPGWAVAGGHAH
ncbi:DnrO protein [Frateuria edaphi]|uniref:DnrO protein n=1 Tax=Frateuria edaphi TaxID=2898793 RepID=UPI001E5378CD|nr:DnrO protein [Frateuria edaphi]UGB47261.1 DnrO protein [Frateuria edaphi]